MISTDICVYLFKTREHGLAEEVPPDFKWHVKSSTVQEIGFLKVALLGAAPVYHVSKCCYKLALTT